MASRRRSFLFLPIVVFVCSIAGGLYGPRMEIAAAATGDDDIKSSLKSFTKAYNLVEENFADQVGPDKTIYNGAIPGMLRTLDPHSNFFDPRSFAIMREDQRGNYYGVGMKVQQRGGHTMVYEPFKGSPAFRAGLRPGDLIVAVNDKPTDNLGSTEVADLLKGPRGTIVKIDVKRDGSEKPLSFNVTRDSITRKSVPDAISLGNGAWYMWIEQFNETTSRELEENLKRIGEGNIKGLILDLRANPGGLLSEGVATADKFLNKDEVIVSHRGRNSPEKVYTARNGNHGHLYPIVVMVNRSSASAAEIVSGALQDHDRAWIFGDNTFGKGLVQTVFPLVENSGLALTTAKYYTPSGRLIQRDYSHTSFFDYYYKANTEARNMQDVKMTDSGRTVYGGGGISPDEKYTPPKLDKFELELLRKSTFFNFTSYYLGTHGTVKIAAGWAPDSSVVSEFHEYLKKHNVEFTEAEFTQDSDWVKHSIQHEMFFSGVSSEDSRVFDIETDPAVKKAVEALPKAQALLNSAKKLIVQRMAK
jgi:carboxyl-terminal processing protease